MHVFSSAPRSHYYNSYFKNYICSLQNSTKILLDLIYNKKKKKNIIFFRAFLNYNGLSTARAYDNTAN